MELTARIGQEELTAAITAHLAARGLRMLGTGGWNEDNVFEVQVEPIVVSTIETPSAPARRATRTPKSSATPDQLTTLRPIVLEYIDATERRGDTHSAEPIAEALTASTCSAVSAADVRVVLEQLCEQGAIRRTGKGRYTSKKPLDE